MLYWERRFQYITSRFSNYFVSPRTAFGNRANSNRTTMRARIEYLNTRVTEQMNRRRKRIKRAGNVSLGDLCDGHACSGGIEIMWSYKRHDHPIHIRTGYYIARDYSPRRLHYLSTVSSPGSRDASRGRSTQFAQHPPYRVLHCEQSGSPRCVRGCSNVGWGRSLLFRVARRC